MKQVVDQLSTIEGQGLVQAHPRPLGPQLQLRDLLPGDVLLSRGTTDVANAIVAVDQGSYSHAALWSGTGVIEAALAGMGEHEFNGDRDVYRHTALPSSAAAEIVAMARAQLSKQYDVHELVLLGLLFAIGWRPRRPVLNLVLSALGGRYATKFEQWLNARATQSAPRICTELVAFSYSAPQGGRFILQILPREHRPTPAQAANQLDELTAVPSAQDSDESDAKAAAATCADLLERHGLGELLTTTASAAESTDLAGMPLDASSIWSAPAFDAAKVLAGVIARDALTGAGLGVVTPGDLQFSPSLAYVGRITAAPAGSA